MLLSDQGWLWARGFEGGGPHVDAAAPHRALADEGARTRGRAFRGDNWLGLKMREASVIKGIGVLPIFAGVIGLLLLLGAFAATWLREGR
jgi:hypothetical protein